MNNEDILQHCLIEIAASRKTPAECARQYPQVPDLLVQLQAAVVLMSGPLATVAPAAAQRHQAQLRAALAANRGRKRQPRALVFIPRWALAAMLAIAMVLGGGGTLSAAAGSLPGQMLYPIKRVTETVQTSLRPASQQAAWHAALAEERTNELAALASRPVVEPAALQNLVAEMGAETAVALSSLANVPVDQQADVLERLLAQIERQQAVLALVHGKVPVQAQASIAQALVVSRTQHEAAIRRLGEVNNRPDKEVPPSLASRTPMGPTDVPPGQAKKTATSAVPPGQAKKTATATAPAATDLPPGQERKTATVQVATDLPPGQVKKTETATAQAAQATVTPPGNAGGQGSVPTPNCSANNPNSPNYCTPSPGAPQSVSEGEAPTPSENPPEGDPPPPTCPLNPAGNPVCGSRP